MKYLFVDDAEIWYGVFHYYVNSLWSGVLPVWNPYMHGGEPFYYNISVLRLTDPITSISILVGKIFECSIFKLYHYQYLIRMYFVSFGVYLCCTTIVKDRLIPFVGMASFLFSKETVGFMSRNGDLDTICWIPFIFYALHLFFQKRTNFSFLLLIYLTGIYIGASNYHFIYGIFLLFIYIITYITLYSSARYKLIEFFSSHHNIALFGGLTLFLYTLPIISIYIESDGIVQAARLAWNRWIDVKYSLPYDKLWSELHGTYFNANDLLNGILTEKYFFWPTIVLSFIGIVYGKNKYKWPIIITAVCTYLSALGPQTPFYKLFYYLFFPLQQIRNVTTFLTFAFFENSLLLIIGIKYLNTLVIKKFGSTMSQIIFLNIILFFLLIKYPILNYNQYIEIMLNYTNWYMISLLVTMLIGLLIIVLFKDTTYRFTVIALFFILAWSYFSPVNNSIYFRETKLTYKAEFNEFAIELHNTIPSKRIFALPRPPYYVFDPALTLTNTALDMLFKPYDSELLDKTDFWREWNMQGGSGSAIGPRAFFLMKDYFYIYNTGEFNIGLFKSLIGVGDNIFTFHGNVCQYSDTERTDLYKLYENNAKTTSLTKPIQLTAFIEDSIAPETGLKKIIQNSDCTKVQTELDEKVMQKTNMYINTVVRVISYYPNDITVEVVAEDDGLLIFRDGYDKYWSVFVDHEKKNLYKANFINKAVFVEKGNHAVRFYYKPTLFIISFYLYFILSVFYSIILIFVYLDLNLKSLLNYFKQLDKSG